MAIIKKFSPKLNLSGYQTLITDDGINSDYFRITEMNETLTGGKNGFLIEGSEHLRETTELKIEILDVEGNPVYFEPGFGIPDYYEGTSILVAVHVYDDTPIGLGKITILGESKTYVDSYGATVDVPNDWKNIYNTKWEREFKINKLISNEDIVRFYKTPIVTIDEIVKSIFNVTVPVVNQTGTLVGIPEFPAADVNLEDWTAGTRYKLKITDGISNWTGSIDEHIINIPSLDFNPTVKDVLNDTEILVDVPFTENGIVKPFDEVGYSIDFEHLESSEYTATAITGSFAKIKINQLKTFVGDVARVKVFRKSRNDVSDFQFIQDIKLESTELLKDISVTNSNEISYGHFTEQVLIDYWETTNASHPISINTNILHNSAFTDYNEIDGGVQLLKTKSPISITKGVEYSLDYFALLNGENSKDSTIRCFISSSDDTQDIIEITGDDQFQIKQAVGSNFISEISGDVHLVFEIKGSDWYISELSFKNAEETSFSPDEVTLIQEVPRKLQTEIFDFKFEFYDINNNYIPVDIKSSGTFDGGNENEEDVLTQFMTFTSDKTAFRFVTGSIGNPVSQQVGFRVTRNLVEGPTLFTSSAFDENGTLLTDSDYSGGQYPGLLTNPSDSGATLTLANFTGSRSDIIVGSVTFTASIDELSEFETIYRFQDGISASSLDSSANTNQLFYSPTSVLPEPSNQKITFDVSRFNLGSNLKPIVVTSDPVSAPPLAIDSDTNGTKHYSIFASELDYDVAGVTYTFTSTDEFNGEYSDSEKITMILDTQPAYVDLSLTSAVLKSDVDGNVDGISLDSGDGSVQFRVGNVAIPHSNGMLVDNSFDIISVIGENCTPNEASPLTNAYGISAFDQVPDSATIFISIGYRDGTGTLSYYDKQVIYTKNKDGLPGSAGTDAQVVKLDSPYFTIEYDEFGNLLNPSSTFDLTAITQNIGEPLFKFTGDNIIDDTVYSAGNGDSDTHSYVPPATYFPITHQIKVSVSENGTDEIAYDTITIFGLKPGTDGTNGLNGSDTEIFYIKPSTGTQIKNNQGTLELHAIHQSGSAYNVLNSGDIKMYDENDVVLSIGGGISDGGSGVEYNPILNASAIHGSKLIKLKSGSIVLDTITLLDVTDGLDGGSIIANNMMTRAFNPHATVLMWSYSPLTLSVTGSFFGSDGTEYQELMTLHPRRENVSEDELDQFWYEIDSDNPNISVIVDDGDGTQFGSGISNKVPTKDVNVEFTFTNPETMEVVKVKETFYIISDGVDGLSAITTVLTNTNHTLPASHEGLVTSYIGSGTDLHMFEGSTELVYDGIGSVSGSWDVSIVETDMISGTLTDEGDYISIADDGVIVAGKESSNLEFNISGTRTTGQPFTSKEIQSFNLSKAGEPGLSGSAGENARIVKLDSSSYVVTYNGSGIETPMNQIITLTTTEQNHFGVPYYEFLRNGASLVNSTDSEYVILDGDEPAPNISVTFSVNVRENSTSGTIMSTDSVTITGLKSGLDGNDATGKDARTIKLDANKYVIQYQKDGSETDSITFSTTTTNTVETPLVYKFYVDGSLKQNSETSTFALENVDEPAIGNSIVVKVEVLEDGVPVASDSVGIYTVQDGTDSITTYLTNPTHTVATNSAGDDGDYTTAGGSFKGWIGSNDVSNSCSFSVVGSPVGVSATIHGTSGIYTITNLTGTSGTATFRMSVPSVISPDGVAFNVDLEYSISKSKSGVDGSGSNAKTTKLSSPSYVISYSTDGTHSPTGTMVLSATQQNVGDPLYKFTGDGISDDTTYLVADEKTFTIPSVYFSTPYQVKVQVADDSQNEVSFDEITISAVKEGTDGNDAYTVIVTNEAHTLSTTSPKNGSVVTYDGSGTEILVFKGITQLDSVSTVPTSTQFRVTANGTNITESTPVLTGTPAVYPKHSLMTEDAGSIEYTIEIFGIDDIKKYQSFSKSIEGDFGEDGDPGLDALTLVFSNDVHTFAATDVGVVSDYVNSGTSITLFEGTTILNYDGIGLGLSTYTVSMNPTNISVGSISDVTDGALIGDLSAMSNSSDVANVEYTITGRRANGDNFTLYKTTSFSKSKEGTDGKPGSSGLNSRAVQLNSSEYIVTYDGDGIMSPANQTIDLSAVEQNHTGSVYYDFLRDTTTLQNTTTDDLTISGSNLPIAGASYTYSVKTREGSSSASISSTDGISIIGLKQGKDGILGENARTIKLDANKYVIQYQKDGSESDSITFTTSITNEVDTPFTYKFYVDGSLKQNSETSTFALENVDEPAIGNSIVVKVEFFEDGTHVASDSVGIYTVQDGTDSMTTYLTNPSHTVATNSAGDDGDYTTAGGSFKGWIGSTDISTSCTYSVQTTNNVSLTINSNGLYSVSNLVGNSSTAILRMSVPSTISPDGVAFNVDLEYSISKSKSGVDGSGSNSKTTKLSSPSYVISYLDNGTHSPTGTMVLSAYQQNFLDPLYKFTGDGVSDDLTFLDYGGVVEKTFTIPSAWFSTPYQIRVGVADGNQSEIAFDEITISAVKEVPDGIDGKPGADAYTVIVTNEAHTLSTTSPKNGSTVTYEGSGTEILVFKGVTELVSTSGVPNSSQFRVTATGSGIVPSTPVLTGAPAVYPKHSLMTEDSGSIEYMVEVLGINNIKKYQSFSKSIEGDFGEDGDPGLDALTIVVKNESHTFPALSNGNVTDYTNSGTDIMVYDGTDYIPFNGSGTSNNSWKVVATPSGISLDGSISDSGNYATIPKMKTMSSDIANVTYDVTGKRSTGQPFTLSKIQSFTKSKQGDVGQDTTNVKLTASSYVVTYNHMSLPSPSSQNITLTAKSQNILNPQYRFLNDKDGTGYSVKQNWSIDDTAMFYTSDIHNPGANDTTDWKVEVRSGTGEFITDDIITIQGLKGGSSGYTVVVSNESHAIPIDADGTFTFPGSRTDLMAYRGSQLLTPVTTTPGLNQFSVSSINNDVTPIGSIAKLSDRFRTTDLNGISQKTGNIEFTFNMENIQSVIKLQSFSKSEDGSQAITSYLTNPSHLVATDPGGNGGDYSNAGGTYKVIVGNADVTTNCSFSVQSVTGGCSTSINSSGVYVITNLASVDNGHVTYEVVIPANKSGNGSITTLTSEYSISKSKSGLTGPGGKDAITVSLDKEIYTYPTNNVGSGPVDIGESKTILSVYDGSAEVLIGGGIGNYTYTLTGDSEYGSTWGGSVGTSGNKFSFTYTSSANWLNSGSITVKVTYKSVDYFVFYKWIKQKEGFDGKRSASGTLHYQLISSTAPSTPTASSFNFDTNLFVGLSANWGYSAPTFASGNSNKYWSHRYDVKETTAGGGSAIPTFPGSSAQSISFSGLVTFSSANNISDGTNSSSITEPSAVKNHIGGTNTTTIDGGVVTTGIIKSSTVSYPAPYSPTDDNFTNSGTIFNLDSGQIRSKNFFIAQDGSASFRGKISAESGDIGGWQIDTDRIFNQSSTGQMELNSSETKILLLDPGEQFQTSINSNYQHTDVSMELPSNVAYFDTPASSDSWVIGNGASASSYTFPNNENGHQNIPDTMYHTSVEFLVSPEQIGKTAEFGRTHKCGPAPWDEESNRELFNSESWSGTVPFDSNASLDYDVILGMAVFDPDDQLVNIKWGQSLTGTINYSVNSYDSERLLVDESVRFYISAFLRKSGIYKIKMVTKINSMTFHRFVPLASAPLFKMSFSGTHMKGFDTLLNFFGRISELSTAGIQIVNNKYNYFRVDRNNHVNYIESSGNFKHDGGLSVRGFYPTLDNFVDIGSSQLRWNDIWATNNIIQTSDRFDKEDIVTTSLGLDFLNLLNPVEFSWKGSTNGRTHFGLIAQEVEEVIGSLDIDPHEFAPLIIDTNMLKDGVLFNAEIDDISEFTSVSKYGLRYGEFISPIIKSIQELNDKIETLESDKIIKDQKISDMEDRLDAIELLLSSGSE